MSQKDVPSGKVRTNTLGSDYSLFFGTDKREGSFPELEPSGKGRGRASLAGRNIRSRALWVVKFFLNHSDIWKKGLYSLFSPQPCFACAVLSVSYTLAALPQHRDRPFTAIARELTCMWTCGDSANFAHTRSMLTLFHCTLHQSKYL